MSDSDSASDSMLKKSIIKYSDIRPISELYTSSVLKPGKTQRFKGDSTLLERVSLFQGDITKLQVDSIVNAANKSLLGGGGVDGAIHAAAGRKLLAECRTLNGCDTGFSKITGAYNLPSKRIIHTVGPVYSSPSVDIKVQQLTSCYQSSLDLAVKNELRHIAFPSISTGIYGYPIEDATHIALNVVRKHFEAESGTEGSGAFKLDRVIFVVWSDKDKSVYESLIPEYFPPVEDSLSSAEREDDGEPVPESQPVDDGEEEWEEVENVASSIAENGNKEQEPATKTIEPKAE
ncbi:hypothetical protein D9757_003760 [Collybiopsis confluens]|uniref:Macro domain-containing protein n=1 Tax=Collybiopsis confluens TaxID=2823264 RepID=A0A8H5HV62_9AGAR|nr:hypothetical protein D9757_003760 [Collybiopsis confluens]